jgi:hypothetical protein
MSEFERALAELTDLTDRDEVAARVERILKDLPTGAKGAEQRAWVLRRALEVAPRVNESFAWRMLEQALQAYDALPEARDQAHLVERATLLEKGLFVAAHFDHVEHVHPLLARFHGLLQAPWGSHALAFFDTAAGQCVRGLRKLGMRDEIEQLLVQMAGLMLEGQDVGNVDFRARENGIQVLRTLLLIAAGWWDLGFDARAEAILRAARGSLLHGEPLQPRDQTQLAVAYVRSLAWAPLETTAVYLQELFDRLEGVRDTYTTASHFSVSQLDVVEAAVLAAVEAVDHRLNRWLEEDERVIRRRIHHDMRTIEAALAPGRPPSGGRR